MTASELVNQLLCKDKKDIEAALYRLLCENKLDFLVLNQAYIRYLECEKHNALCDLLEAETCICESLCHDTPKRSKLAENSVQRRLFFLNRSGKFKMDVLNKKFKYDADRAETYSHADDLKIK